MNLNQSYQHQQQQQQHQYNQYNYHHSQLEQAKAHSMYGGGEQLSLNMAGSDEYGHQRHHPHHEMDFMIKNSNNGKLLCQAS